MLKSRCFFLLIFFICECANLFAFHPLKQSHEKESEFIPSLIFFSVRQDLGAGIGYETGYTTLEELLFTKINQNWSPFLDVKVHRFLNDRYATNIGIGSRFFSESLCKVFGMNLYYDYRNINYAHFNQLGFGWELLSNQWNVHINGYFPLGNKRVLSCSAIQTSDQFFLKRRNYDVALTGLNLEGEVLIGKPRPLSFYGLGGFYYYKNSCKDVIGGELGIFARYKQILFLKITYTFDDVFKQRFQGMIGLSFPLGEIPKIKDKLKSCTLSGDIMFDSIKRNEIIALDKHCKWEWNY
jgi:hypothetical protein